MKFEKNEEDWEKLEKNAQPEKAVSVESNHPLYILYTSGTTGNPKGIYRDHGGTCAGLILSMEIGFGFTEKSTIFATSDFGWVVGHSYIVYGPLLLGGTSIIYEGKPIKTPDVSAYFKIVEKYKVDVLYSSPTAIRAIRREDPLAKIVKQSNLSSLRVFGVVGERTDVHTYKYIQQIMPKNCLYNDTYWQTETGWFLSANYVYPQRFTTKGGSCTKPYPGYDVRIYGDDKKEIKQKMILGHVLVKLPMPPSFMLSIWGNDESFVQKYLTEFPGFYQTGDAGYFDKDGYLHILTRTDDIIQVAGHRLSTARMEEAVLSHQSLAEAVVVGIKDDIKGQLPFSVVVLKKGEKISQEQLFKELKMIVREEIGPVACLYNFSIVKKLPKTRSGKILRRTIRKIIDKDTWTVPATIEDESVLKDIQKIAEEVQIQRKPEIEFEDFEKMNKKVKIE